MASVGYTLNKEIDRQKILDAITQDGRELGVLPQLSRIKPKLDIRTFKTLPSTSTYLWEKLRIGQADSGTAIIAQCQSAGRGQRGRQWESEAGGLYLSLAIEPNWPITHSAQLTCLSAWGITTALNNLGIAANIKWPNDILYKGKKLGGILTETKLSHATLSADDFPQAGQSEAIITQAVIGVGMNWHNPVPKTGINLLNILETDESIEVDKNKINCLEVLIALVLRGILQGVIFQQQVGSQVFMKAYQKLLTQVGRTVSLDSNGKLSLASPVQDISDRRLSPQSSDLWANRSGEVVGISEEGYLEVALSRSNHHIEGHLDSPNKKILRLKPSEICIS